MLGKHLEGPLCQDSFYNELSLGITIAQSILNGLKFIQTQSLYSASPRSLKCFFLDRSFAMLSSSKMELSFKKNGGSTSNLHCFTHLLTQYHITYAFLSFGLSQFPKSGYEPKSLPNLKGLLC